MGFIHQADIDGCHVTVEEMKPGEFFATVSYKVYNTLGVWIASPEWQTIGDADEVKEFIVHWVTYAQRDNKPPSLDTIALLFPHLEIVQ